MNTLFHQSLDILKVSSHSQFEMLLCVADIDLVHHFTGNPVNDDRHSAIIPVLTLARSSSSSAVAVPYLKIQGLDSFG